MPLNNQEEYIEEVQERIDKILLNAKEVIDKKLAPANALIQEVKDCMVKGMDCITMEQLQEWSIVIPILSQDLLPYKEAFGLMKDLWDIETKQLAAKNLLELDLKKTEIENINKVAGTENAKKKAISDYISRMLAGTQENLWVLSVAIRKMIDVRKDYIAKEY